MKDIELRQYVIDELEFEPSLNAAEIGVAVDAGVVTLSGHVPCYAHKLAAEKAAWRVKGVKAVAQEIQVRFPEDKKHNDDEIARRAVDILGWDSMLPREAIRVKVQDGWVTLAGELDWNYQRDIAENDVYRLGGVKGVHNTIQIRRHADPVDVKTKITEALKRHAEVEADHVDVSVRGTGTVCLTGEVGSAVERRAAVNAAWRVQGVQAVVDGLRIA